MSQSKNSAESHEENSDVSFVSRWSRLKHETRQDIDNEPDANNPVATAAPDGELQPAVDILTDADMPDIDSLTPDSDYTDFLSPGVSEKLRKLALRKLFRSEVFNIRDGLDEYDDDFTQFEPLGDVVTSDMKHQLELEAQRKAEQMLQHEQLLPDDVTTPGDATTIEQEVIDNDDSADDKKIAAHQQNISQPPLDESDDDSKAADMQAKNQIDQELNDD